MNDHVKWQRLDKRRRLFALAARQSEVQEEPTMMTPPVRLRGPVLDVTPEEAPALAAFYEQLLGWEVTDSHPGGWAMVQSPDRSLKIEIQGTSDYRPPVWPTVAGEQQMMIHLDFATSDVESAMTLALELGASLAEHQVRPEVRVMLDPAGHPFCLFQGAV